MKKLLLSSLLIANGVIAAPFVVKYILVEGGQPTTGADIISSIPIRVGQTATDTDISNVVLHLFNQQLFSDVRATIKKDNMLVIKVKENQIIGNLAIEGNNIIPKDALMQNLKANLISQGEFFDAAKLEAFNESLVDHYQSVGHYQAHIDTILTNNDAGGVNVKLAINEGDATKAKTIMFEGNNSFSDEKLLKNLDIQPNVPWWNIFESSKFEQAAHQKDLETIRDFYLERGYAKFAVQDVDVKFNDSKTEVYLTYKLSEGSQYNINEMRIIGDTANMDNQLNALLKDFKPGQLFRKSDLVRIEEGIKQILGDAGYGLAKVDLHPQFNDVDNTVKISLVVDAGHRIYVRKIRFEGNDVTADSTLRREMRQQEGAWFSTTKTALGKARLERTGFYESVEMMTPNVENTTDQVDVVYKIKERKTGSINFGVGYGTESGISYQAGIKQENFLGMGSTISLNGTRNDYGNSVNLGYTEPYFTKDGVSLGGNIFYEDYNNSKKDNVASYKRQTYGVNGTLGFPVDENNSYYLGLGYTHDKINNVAREYTREKYVNAMNFEFDPHSDYYKKIKAYDFDFSLGWNYNSLNRGYFPTEGITANIGGKITIPGSDNRYYSMSADFRNYYPLNREHNWVISTKAGIAYANGFGGKKVPFYQLYTAGGIGSLRGFSYGTIGPQAIYYNLDDGRFNHVNNDIIGGNALAKASLELITPTPFISEKNQHHVRTSIFVDAASAWNTKWKKDEYPSLPDYGNFKRFRASVGVAFQWLSPIGPLSFSYAKPIRKYNGDEIEQFQFNIGGTF